MASQWVRTVTLTTACAVIAAAGALSSTPALAATAAACKNHPASAACKPAAKKPSAKSAGKSTAAKGAKKGQPASKATAKGHGKAVASKSAAKGKAAFAKGKKSAKGRQKAVARRVISPEELLAKASASPGGDDVAALRSSTAFVQDMRTSNVLFAKNENVVRPIASISKLMTALVVLDAHQSLDEMIEITDDDIDTMKHTRSRLPVGTRLSRNDMLHLALMASENRAANALGRNYPGGLPAFVAAMNAKARSLGMVDTRFVEPTGLSSENVSSPRDLALMLRAAVQHPLIHQYTTDSEYEVPINARMITFHNTDMLVRRPDWDILVSKTGFINEAGQCLVMMARIASHDIAIVLLDSRGSLSRIGDAVRIRRILERQIAML